MNFRTLRNEFRNTACNPKFISGLLVERCRPPPSVYGILELCEMNFAVQFVSRNLFRACWLSAAAPPIRLRNFRTLRNEFRSTVCFPAIHFDGFVKYFINFILISIKLLDFLLIFCYSTDRKTPGLTRSVPCQNSTSLCVPGL